MLELKPFKPFRLPGEDKDIYIEPKLKKKLNILAGLLKIKDVWIIVDGNEGDGKSNAAAYLLWYYHCLTGRPFSLNTFYFNTEKLLNFAKTTENQLINFDEAAFGALSTEWWNKAQLDLVKFSMVGRKKHHIFVLCIPKFDKLKDYLRNERSHALINMDCGKTGKEYGRYKYLTRRGKAMLDRIWRMKKIRPYRKCMALYGGHGGYIPYVFDKLVDLNQYEKMKDEAIESVGVKTNTQDKQKLNELKKKISSLKFPIESKKQFAEKLGLSTRAIEKWAYVDASESIENKNFSKNAKAETTNININNGVEE